jgi:hypothetical protein
MAELPGHAVGEAALRNEGFAPLSIEVRRLGVALPNGSGCEWTTQGNVPTGPGLYAFSVEDGTHLHVTYVGQTEELWMVTKGRLPAGPSRSRPAQRYGRPRYAGITRQRINVLIAEQLQSGRTVRHWVQPLANAPASPDDLRGHLTQAEEALIQRWRLRHVGWNRG